MYRNTSTYLVRYFRIDVFPNAVFEDLNKMVAAKMLAPIAVFADASFRLLLDAIEHASSENIPTLVALSGLEDGQK